MRDFLVNLKAALREMVNPRWTHDEDEEQSAAEQVRLRSAWVQEHRRPEGGD